MSKTEEGVKKPNWIKRHPVWTVIIVIFVLGLIGAGTSGDSTKTQTASAVTPTQAPTENPSPTPTPQPMTRDEWMSQRADFETSAKAVTVADMYKDPNAYAGKTVYFTCTVDNFPKDENGNVSAINCSDPNDFSSNVQVNIKDAGVDITKVNKGDLIQVDALGDGTLSGTNAFGGTIQTAGVTIGIGYFEDKTTGFINNY